MVGVMRVKYLDMELDMEPEIYWNLPQEQRSETLVDVDGNWVRLDRFQADQADSDLSAALEALLT